eukprot:gene56916-biopygen84030
MRLRQAWGLYALFSTNAKKQQRIATRLFGLSTMTAWLTTLTAVVITASKDVGTCNDSWLCYLRPYTYALSLVSALLPLLAAFFLSLKTALNPSVKAAMLRSAASDVLREIYEYRCR